MCQKYLPSIDLIWFFALEERALPENDKVYETLEALRKKQLPGVSVAAVTKVARALKSDGKTSSVQMNDDNIIKLIVNKKLNTFERDFHLIRVFMYDESNLNIRTYKTIAVNTNVTVKTITDMVMKKFKLDLDPDYSYRLCTIIKNQGMPKLYLFSLIIVSNMILE
jgi:hypothetical protein